MPENIHLPGGRKCHWLVYAFAGIGVAATLICVFVAGTVAYIVLADPFGIKPLIQELRGVADDVGSIFGGSGGYGPNENGGPGMQGAYGPKSGSQGDEPLSQAQMQMMREAGISPEMLERMGPEFQACAVQKLGSRAEQIEGPEDFTLEDWQRVQSCL